MKYLLKTASVKLSRMGNSFGGCCKSPELGLIDVKLKSRVLEFLTAW